FAEDIAAGIDLSAVGERPAEGGCRCPPRVRNLIELPGSVGGIPQKCAGSRGARAPTDYLAGVVGGVRPAHQVAAPEAGQDHRCSRGSVQKGLLAASRKVCPADGLAAVIDSPYLHRRGTVRRRDGGDRVRLRLSRSTGGSEQQQAQKPG